MAYAMAILCKIILAELIDTRAFGTITFLVLPKLVHRLLNF